MKKSELKALIREVIEEMNPSHQIDIPDDWIPSSEPPDTNRDVQLMWDDGSTGPNSIGFYDEKDIIPPNGEKFWWEYGSAARLHPHPLPDGAVVAWKELKK